MLTQKPEIDEQFGAIGHGVQTNQLSNLLKLKGDLTHKSVLRRFN